MVQLFDIVFTPSSPCLLERVPLPPGTPTSPFLARELGVNVQDFDLRE